MRINGKEIAEEIVTDLKKQVDQLRSSGVIPTLAIITLGPEESWKTYVGQKIKLGKRLGVQIKLINLSDAQQEDLLAKVYELNNDALVHGIIVQRPFPKHIDDNTIVNAIGSKKDVDGFRSDSQFEVPVWLAVKKMLQEVHEFQDNQVDFLMWLNHQKIVIVGNGVTAGRPIKSSFLKLGIKAETICRDTPSPEEILRSADIIISAVGKTIIQPTDLKHGVVLVGVGLHRNDEGKLQGDYDEEQIVNIASFYTPSPGGVGPINIAYLFKNLISSISVV